MALKQELQAYQDRWRGVEAIQAEERASASLALRWQQLNSLYGLAKGLGLVRLDPGELEVMKRWAKLKEKVTA